jgi:hypothetical protein
MPDVELLGVVLAVLYLADSASLAEPAEIGFVGWQPGRWRRRHGIEANVGSPRLLTCGTPWPPLHPVVFAGGDRLDAREAERRLAELEAAGRAVRPWSNALFFLIFGAVPALIAVAAPATWWYAALTLVAVAWLAAAYVLVRALRRVRSAIPTASGKALPAVLSPLSLIRGLDVLSRNVFRDLHPVAVAAALCPEDELVRLARMHHFAADGRSNGERRDLEAFLRERGAWAAVTAPPAPDPGAVAYCPRCRVQMRADAGTCPDCSGVQLMSF